MANGFEPAGGGIGGVGTGEGGQAPGFDFGAFMQNRLVQQYLSGAGASIAGPGSFAADIDKMNQQNISAQSQAATQKKYMQMLSKLLGKGPEFSSDKDGKIKIGAENVEAMGNILSGGDDFDPLARTPLGGGTSASSVSATPTTPLPAESTVTNPFLVP